MSSKGPRQIVLRRTAVQIGRAIYYRLTLKCGHFVARKRSAGGATCRQVSCSHCRDERQVSL